MHRAEVDKNPPPACNAPPGLHVARLLTKAVSPTQLCQLNPRYPNPTPDLPCLHPPRGPSRLQQATPIALGGHWVVPRWSSQKCSMQHPPAPLGTAALTGWAMRDGGGASWPQKPSTSVQLLLRFLRLFSSIPHSAEIHKVLWRGTSACQVHESAATLHPQPQTGNERPSWLGPLILHVLAPCAYPPLPAANESPRIQLPNIPPTRPRAPLPPPRTRYYSWPANALPQESPDTA